MEFEMDARQERGLQIAEQSTIVKTPVGWKVPSQSGKGSYIVTLGSEPFCTCPDFESRHLPCKHIHAVEFILQREQRPDGTTIVTETIKVTYGQDWPVYNAAQMHEQEYFANLLRDLCDGIPQPTQTFGRPRLPLSDVVFGLVSRSYASTSGRRFTSELKDAQSKGLLSKAAHYNSAFRYLENPELTPLLKTLIEQSACPLKAVETDFAVDSSGFATTTYDRWFDHKYGKMKSEARWVKAHLMCGVKTHTVTSVEVTPTETADAPQLPQLVNTTAQTFQINEVSADKAYSSRKNLQTVNATGGVPYIPFKSYSKGSQGNKPFDGLWNHMWHYYSFNKSVFLQHYHKRSNVETTFSMIKGKFGDSVRAKSPTAQVNEVLCKVLCHNICVLIQSIFELGLEPMFWTSEAKIAVAPKVLQNIGF
ncbi:MAG: transposase [Dehalococcoidia bacterium]|nr:MAG: transposase [Dehalococcoidia bacterium]